MGKSIHDQRIDNVTSRANSEEREFTDSERSLIESELLSESGNDKGCLMIIVPVGVAGMLVFGIMHQFLT